MSYLYEAATEMHFPTPHSGLTKRLQTVHQHETGAIARAYDEHAATLPSDRYVWAAVGAVGVGLSILTMGLYNAMVKVVGSNRLDR